MKHAQRDQGSDPRRFGYRDYLRAVWKYWWLVLLAVLLSGGAAAWATMTTPKQYSTQMTFFVKTPSTEIGAAAQGDTFGQKRVDSYVQLANTDKLLNLVLSDTKLTIPIATLSAEISASADINTVLLKVDVTDPSPDRSMLIAKSVSVQFVKVVSQLESNSTGSDSTVSLELVSGPTLDTVPVEPRPFLNYAIGLTIGLILGIAVAVLRELIDTSIRTSLVLERVTGAPVMGIIPFDSSAKEHPLIIYSHAQSLRAEAFRQLRTNLQFVDVDTPVKTVVITSSVAEEGKSSTAANLAVIFAEAGRNVLLVEADLRRPRVANYLGLEGSVGLTNLLAGQVSLNDVLQPWGRGGLTVLPSGSVPPNPSELLGSKAMVDALKVFAEQFDLVLIDSPPLLPVTDAAIIAARADGALVIVRHGSTRRAHVELAVAALGKVDARLLGCVLNMAPTTGADSYMYGYGYQTYADNVTVFEQIPQGAIA